MPCEIQLTQSEPTWLAVVREQVRAQDLSCFVPAACGEVWSFIKGANLPKPGRHVAVHLDGQGNVEVGAEVAEPFTGNDRVHCSKLPAGPVATATHYGPYGRLGEAHAAIRTWCAEHEHPCSPVSWEIYGHLEETWNAAPSKIRTDVFMRIERTTDSR
jgi:hypothetical protein